MPDVGDTRIRVTLTDDDRTVAEAIAEALGMNVGSILRGALHRGLLAYSVLAVEIDPAKNWPNRPALLPVNTDDLRTGDNAHYRYWLAKVRKGTGAAPATSNLEGSTGGTPE